ncbi:MICOS complex subunit MIC60-like protein isoform 1 [Solanum lycopersicum]|uniref:MICOS complex subunit MIC60-like protein isoform 1 n=1 Tax=Solanum lycopersicum TaxID=4081 RepID=UPI0002765832|nr:MICOS complex subunit MIC60-like protein isoform 1 [Solanum lycopersicum]
MLRRSILRLSAGQSVKRIPAEVITQVPSYLFSRREFSVSPKQNGPPRGPGSTGKPKETVSLLPRFIIGSVALSAGFFAAYQTGYLDKYLIKEPHSSPELARDETGLQGVKELKESSEVSQDSETLGRPDAGSKFVESDSPEQTYQSIGIQQDLSGSEEPTATGSESQFQVNDSSEITGGEANYTEVKELSPSSHQENVSPDETRLTSTQSPEDTLDMKSPEVSTDAVQSKAIEITPTPTQADTLQKENEASVMSPEHVISQAKMEDAPQHEEKPSSLLDEYYLRNGVGATPTTSSDKKMVVEDLGDSYISKDGKLVLDVLQVIHETESRQAELDARLFAEEKKYMKERYEKELKDARARELMYAEREALLDKELKKERAKAIAALKSLKEKLEEEHKTELEEKEDEAELKLKKAQELGKAQLDAAIASEKASQIEKMAEANLHINALCMAFYARSEEVRQTHSVHKLALGVLALEDALSRGLPIQKELENLHTSLEGIDNNSLLDVVLSSLPEETQRYGSDTVLQLNHKFDTLKGTLRHFSLIPPGGGGILTHSLASVASWLKVREAGQSGDGIESLINKVESFLAQGKLSEAADALEKGLKDTHAAEIVDDWVKRARNRAITEQALTLLQSYATTIST